MDVVIYTDLNYLGHGRYAGPYRVATELRRHGFTVKVVDFFSRLSFQEILATIDKYVDKRTLFIGMATTFLGERGFDGEKGLHRDISSMEEWKAEFYQALLNKNPQIKIVAGGAHAFALEGQVDFCVTGNADVSAVAIARHLKFGEPLTGQLSPKGRSIIVSSRENYPVNDFNQSFIEWQADDYLQPDHFVPIEIARGCIFRCAFCSYPLNGKRPKDYIKAADTLRHEMITNYEQFGITRYTFCDDTYNDSLEKVRALHEVFTSLPFQIEFVCYLRLDIIDKNREMRDLLLESGLVSAFFGIETLNQDVGRKIGKGLHPERTKDVLNFLKDGWNDRVNMMGSFIVGLPGEGKESILQTYEWLMHERNPLDCFFFETFGFDPEGTNPDNASKITLEPQKYGYVRHGHLWENQLMNIGEAYNLAQDLIRRAGRRNKVCAFDYAQVRNLGFTREQAWNMSWQEYCERKDEINARLRFARDRYVTSILS